MPMGDRFPRRRRGNQEPRDVREGDGYTVDEEREGLIRRIEVDPTDDQPAEETRGEPWGWTKGPPYPRGWREDGQYGQNRDDPGPYDGSWDPPDGGG